jgi:hypothetical protein
MWCRAIAAEGGIVFTDVLCSYRIHEAAVSGRLARTGGNLLDVVRLNDVFAKRYPSFSKARGLDRVSRMAAAQAERFQEGGDWEAHAANIAFYRRHAPLSLKLRRRLSRFVRSIVG